MSNGKPAQTPAITIPINMEIENNRTGDKKRTVTVKGKIEIYGKPRDLGWVMKRFLSKAAGND